MLSDKKNDFFVDPGLRGNSRTPPKMMTRPDCSLDRIDGGHYLLELLDRSLVDTTAFVDKMA